MYFHSIAFYTRKVRSTSQHRVTAFQALCVCHMTHKSHLSHKVLTQSTMTTTLEEVSLVQVQSAVY